MEKKNHNHIIVCDFCVPQISQFSSQITKRKKKPFLLVLKMQRYM